MLTEQRDPSFIGLRRDGFDVERNTRLHPEAEPGKAYVAERLEGRIGSAIAATDYVRALCRPGVLQSRIEANERIWAESLMRVDLYAGS